MKDQLLTILYTALATLIPVLGTFLATWLRSRTQALTAARMAGQEVENLAAQPDVNLTAGEKQDLAVQKIRASFPHISPARATAAFQRVAPELVDSSAVTPRQSGQTMLPPKAPPGG
jgi:hypothetical protein